MKRRAIVIAVSILITAAAAVTVVLLSGKDDLLFQNDAGIIDARHADDGIVRVIYTGAGETRVKVQVIAQGGTTQNYNMNMDGEYGVFPLHAGGGSYIVRIAEQVEGTEYRVAHYASFVAECSETAPFLQKNVMVQWKKDGIAESRASELASNADSAVMNNLAPGASREARLVGTCGAYVAYTITYRMSDEATISGYIPDPDDALYRGEGICLDYAAALAAMLRSQGVPAKLVVGWAGEVYHAWVDAFVDGEWVLCDPTFTASANGDEKMLEFMAERGNYTVRYVY